MGRKVKLGIFIVVGILLLTALIFYLGSRQRIFGKNVKLVAVFDNVSGLKEGNIVTYSGVEIGTVKSIDILNDTMVRVTMLIDSDDIKFIKKDSRASIGTEGLLGTKFIKLLEGSPDAPGVEHGDEIASTETIDFDKLIRVLNRTSESALDITKNLDSITTKIVRGEGTLGTLISDKEVLTRVENMVTSFESAGYRTNELIDNVNSNTTLISNQVRNLTDSLQIVSSNAIKSSENIVSFSEKLNDENGTLGRLLTDTLMGKEIDETLNDVQTAAQDIQQTSCKVRNHWFLKLFNKNKDGEVCVQ
ncbi:MAG TPA: MlaD family protein [Cytophagaceae bacterium]